MEGAEILAIALEEQARARGIIAGLGPCPITLSRATTLLGTYSVDVRTGLGSIRISRHIVGRERVVDTARHELAHQAAYELQGHLGHGALWQMWARYLGCAPVSCEGAGIDPDALGGVQRYALTCAICGWRITRQKRSKVVRHPRRYACGRCRGPLNLDVL